MTMIVWSLALKIVGSGLGLGIRWAPGGQTAKSTRGMFYSTASDSVSGESETYRHQIYLVHSLSWRVGHVANVGILRSARRSQHANGA